MTSHFVKALVVRILAAAISFGFSVLVARALGVEQFGLFAMMLAIINVGIVVSLLGHENQATRLVASASAGSLEKFRAIVIDYRLAASKRIVFASLLVSCVALAIIALTEQNSIEDASIFLMALLIPIIASTRFNQGIIRGAHYASLAIVPDGVVRPAVAAVVLAYVMWASNPTFLLVAIVMLASSALAYFLSRSWADAKTFQNSIDGSNVVVNKASTSIQAGIPIAMYLSSIIAVASSQISVFLTGSIGGADQAAIYAAAERYAVATGLIGQAMYQASASRLASLFVRGDFASMRRLVRNLTRAVCGASLVAVSVVAIGADFFLGLFGHEYVQAKILLWILLGGVLLNVSAGPVGFILLMTGNETKHLVSLVISFCVQIALLFLLVPRYGGVGAATAVLISTIIWNVVMAEFVTRALSFRRLLLFA